MLNSALDKRPHKILIKAMTSISISMSKSLRNPGCVIDSPESCNSSIHFAEGKQAILLAIHNAQGAGRYKPGHVVKLSESKYTWNSVAVAVMYQTVLTDESAE